MTPLSARPSIRLLMILASVPGWISFHRISAAALQENSPAIAPSETPAAAPLTEALISEDSARPQFSLGPVARSAAILDDARLNDVCRVGQFCWAVGDHGVVVTSADAGATWETRCLPTDCRLTSVSFLTDKVGWVAGVRFIRGSDHPSPVLMSTRDGGLTWKNLAESQDPSLASVSAVPVNRIPGFRQIRYFGLHDALAICFPIPDRTNATVIRTKDGGLTWEPIRREGQTADVLEKPPSELPIQLKANEEPLFEAACMLSESEAIVGGPGLSYATIVGEQLVPIGMPTATLRSARGLSAETDSTAWIVGDGGFVLRSDNGGISWIRNKPLISPEADRLLDFSAVAQNGDCVLIAGCPASIIFRSEDSGQTWKAVRTGMQGSISRLIFVDSETTLAVGDLGAILRSSDGGRSWNIVRSQGYRTGLMNFVTAPGKQSWDVMAAVSADEGIRSVSIQLSAEQIPGGAKHRMIAGEAAQEIVSGLGGNAFVSDWMFSRIKTEQHRSQSQLIQEWNRQSDGRLQSLLPTRLAAWIRTWRPTVIVIEPLDDEDAVAGILNQVMDAAIRLAAGNTSGDDHPILASLQLAPWQVRRVVQRTRTGQSTTVRFRSTDLLENCGTTNGMLVNGATEPLVWMGAPALPALSDNCYELISASEEFTPAGLLAGLEQHLSVDARRSFRKRGIDEVQQLKATAQRAHIESSAAVGQLERATTENALIAQLQSMAAGLPETFALQQLKGLGETTRKRGDIDGYIAVQQEVVRRFPNTSDALLAAEELFIAYSSSEVRKLRVDRMQKRHPLAGRLPGVSPIGQAQIASGDAGIGESVEFAPKVEAASAVQFSSAANDQGSSILTKWDQQAAVALQLLGNGDAAQMSSRIGLRHAANLRLAGKLGEQSSIISVLTQREDAWQIMARSEMQSVHSTVASPVPVLNIQKSPERPLLDGELTDACWEEAVEIPLTDSVLESGVDPGGTGFMLLTWDDQFVYIAGRMNHLRNGPAPEPKALNRKHDALHGVRDRVEFSFDLDRDYTTSFDFRIDQTGQTSEDCWGIRNWDPQWFVATNDDETSWRFEVAIPIQSLALANLRAGEMWAVRFRRVIPAYTTQVLTGSNSEGSTADGLGLVRFIRRQRK